MEQVNLEQFLVEQPKDVNKKKKKKRKEALVVTSNYVKEVIEYDAETGVVRWKIEKGKAHMGQEIKSPNAAGYYQIGLLNGVYLLHRVIWLYVTGSWPNGIIDHVDRVKSNNTWNNLRDVSYSQNAHNTKLQINNTSGYRGVYWSNNSKRWVADIKVSNKIIHLGRFHTKEAARDAYEAAAKEHNFR